MQTDPSSAPVTKKSSATASAVWDSCGTSIFAGSASEPVVKILITLSLPTVTNFRPFLVKPVYVEPCVSVYSHSQSCPEGHCSINLRACRALILLAIFAVYTDKSIKENEIRGKNDAF